MGPKGTAPSLDPEGDLLRHLYTLTPTELVEEVKAMTEPQGTAPSRPSLDAGGFCPHGIGGGIGCSECEQAEVWPVTAVLGDLIHALSDNLAHEVSHSADVVAIVRRAIVVLDDERFASYLDAWWLA